MCLSVAVQWRRLVRFVNPAGRVCVGEPLGASGDSGAYRQARLLDTDDIYRPDARVTDRIEAITKVRAAQRLVRGLHRLTHRLCW